MADYNGYLDSDQTIINYAVREMGGTFAQTLEDDPSRMLRNWLKCRRAAQNTSIGTTLFGAIAAVAGVFTGAGTLLIAGVAVAAGSGFLIKHHSEGAAACEMESEILDNCRPILGLLVELEQRGASPSDLVSLYDRLVRAASAKVNPLDVTDRQQLHAFFQAELEQSAILSNLSGSAHGLGAAMTRQTPDRTHPIAPALGDAPVAIAPIDSFSAEGSHPPEPAVNLNLNPEINVHNHIGRPGQPHRTASPAQSDRRTAAPDLSLYPDIRERMTVLLKAMAESGLPLGTLLNHPFVWCWGRSQSGKTTIALLLATARLAMGHQVSYFTTDDDYPRSLPWQRVEDTPEGYAVALDDAVETMSAAGKGKLKGQGWVFDELFAAAAQHKIEIQPLLTCVLMKGAKCGAGSIGISQADTSTAHGLKGIDTAWREERVSVQAIHEEDAIGNRHPTGRYIVNRGEDSQEWCIPEWMLTELNAEGSPDPMVWVLNRFPELSKPVTTSTPQQSDRNEATVEISDAATDSSEPLEKLSRYLASKGKIDLRTLDKNWGRNNSFQGDALKELLTQLESRGSIVTWQDGIIWKG